MTRILIIIVCLALSTLLGVLFLWPKYQNLKNLQLQMENKEIEINNRNTYFQNLRSLSEKLEGFKEDVAKIEAALPSNPSPPSFYNFLQKTVSENGLILKNIGSFAVSPLASNPSLKVISLPLGVSGSYASLKNFLGAMEKSARIVEVNTISFSAPQNEELFDFTLEIQSHSY